MQDKSYKKYLSIDYGTKRIGLAAGAIFPKGLGVIDTDKGDEHILNRIREIVSEDDFTGIVIGLPVRSQGEPGTIDSKIRDFAREVSALSGLNVYFEREDFSSAEAHEMFVSHDKKIERKSGDLDEMAAIIILERFLDRKRDGLELKPDVCP